MYGIFGEKSAKKDKLGGIRINTSCVLDMAVVIMGSTNAFKAFYRSGRGIWIFEFQMLCVRFYFCSIIDRTYRRIECARGKNRRRVKCDIALLEIAFITRRIFAPWFGKFSQYPHRKYMDILRHCAANRGTTILRVLLLLF